MKGSLIYYSLLVCFESVNALYPPSINQVKNYDTTEHMFQRRMDKQDIKPFNVTIECSGSQCKKATETLDKLTNTLSSFIQVKNQIYIKAYFISFCKEFEECGKNDKNSLSSNSLILYETLKNKEGRELYYHRALFKQIADPSELPNSSFLNSTDFVLYFNSDLVYWFEGDGDIEANQPNFLLVAASELIKALGARVSISGYGIDGLIFSPGFSIILDDSFEIAKGVDFERNILDSLIVTTSDNKSINSLLDPYFNFESGIISVPFKDLYLYLKNTTLIEPSKKIEKLATTPNSLAIKLPSGKSLILETSIQPFDPSRSIRFISESKYLHTKEALLTSKVLYGEEPLPQGKAEDWPTYPFGPLLIETLELMGYTLKDSYKNSVASSSSNKDGDKENNKSGNSSSNIKAKFSLLAALFSLYLLC